MQFFIDSADTKAIAELAATGMVDGVTTNPSLVAESGRDFKQLIGEICEMVDGPVSAEVTALEADAMLAEADELLGIAPNVCIKVPLTWDGLRATRVLADKGVKVNGNALLFGQSGFAGGQSRGGLYFAFVGRLDDIATDGMGLIADIRQIYDNYPELETEILVASVRSPEHIRQSALIGADVATLPPDAARAD